MKIGTIQVQIYAPKFLACQPDLNNLPLLQMNVIKIEYSPKKNITVFLRVTRIHL